MTYADRLVAELDRTVLDPANPATTPLPYTEAAVRKAVALAVGAGSTCWSPMNGTGVFDTESAVEIVDATAAAVVRLTGLGVANLGCATTAELRAELETREKLGAPHTDPDYRTVGES